jgi:CREB-regulated transcription coactivator 1
MVLFLNELFYSSIYPSAHVPGAIQIPISGNNTGSLPDLTNVNFSSPIRVPLDQDLDQGSSPYSSVSILGDNSPNPLVHPVVKTNFS